MKFLTVIVLSLLGIVGSTEKLSKTDELKLRMTDFMVKLEIPKPGGCMVCSGSVILKNWILTAGHCIIEADYLIVYPPLKNAVSYTVNKTDFFTRTYIQRSQLHNDIALIRFPYNRYWGDIFPVSLPNGLDLPSAYHGKKAILNRFGSVCTGNSSKLYIVPYLTILKEQSCTLATHLFFFDTPLGEEHLCARPRHSYLCEGDSSGHLVLEDSNELVGILSQPKDKPCSELIFSRINFYTKFIELVTGIDIPGGGLNSRNNSTLQGKTTLIFEI